MDSLSNRDARGQFSTAADALRHISLCSLSPPTRLSAVTSPAASLSTMKHAEYDDSLPTDNPSAWLPTTHSETLLSSISSTDDIFRALDSYDAWCRWRSCVSPLCKKKIGDDLSNWRTTHMHRKEDGSLHPLTFRRAYLEVRQRTLHLISPETAHIPADSIANLHPHLTEALVETEEQREARRKYERDRKRAQRQRRAAASPSAAPDPLPRVRLSGKRGGGLTAGADRTRAASARQRDTTAAFVAALPLQQSENQQQGLPSSSVHQALPSDEHLRVTELTVATSLSAPAPPTKTEPIAADEVEQEQQRINRQNRKRERDLKFLQEVTGRVEHTMDKRRREQRDGPATQQMRQLVSNVSKLLDEKRRLTELEQQLVQRLAQAGIDAQLEVERLQSKSSTGLVPVVELTLEDDPEDAIRQGNERGKVS